jgi:DNA-binding NtrC family response regulator
MKYNTKIIDDYERLISGLPQVLELYNINISAMCRDLKLNRKTLYDRIEQKSFTPDELRKIANYLNR